MASTIDLANVADVDADELLQFLPLDIYSAKVWALACDGFNLARYSNQQNKTIRD